MVTINQDGDKIKNTLAYSEMTDKVYWVDGRGKKHDVTDQYRFVMISQVKAYGGGWKEKITDTSSGKRYELKVSFDEIIEEDSNEQE